MTSFCCSRLSEPTYLPSLQQVSLGPDLNNNINNNNNNNMRIYKAHNVSKQAESEAPAVARWG